MEITNRYAEMVSFGAYLPEKKVTTTSFASPSDLPRSLDFVRLTGILAHHEVSKEQGSFELAIEAAKKAISRAKIEPDSIDLVINASVSKMNHELSQHLSPSYASLIADNLKINNAQCFDVSNACASMVTSLMIAESRIKSGQANYALIVSTPASSTSTLTTSTLTSTSMCTSTYVTDIDIDIDVAIGIDVNINVNVDI